MYIHICMLCPTLSMEEKKWREILEIWINALVDDVF